MEHINSPADEQSHHSPPPSVSFLKTLYAPWMIHSPKRAARNMAGGSPLAFWMSFALTILLLAAVIVMLIMWHQTVTITFTNVGRETKIRSMAEVWSQWHAHGIIGRPELLLFAMYLIMPLHVAASAWLYLPNVHNGGSVWKSYLRTYRAMAVGLGPLTVGILFIGVPVMASRSMVDGNIAEDIVRYAMFFSIAGACFLLYWLSRATRAVAGLPVEIDLPPRCEVCGYDLTHQPDSGLCSECGRPIDQSLTPELTRPGCHWQNSQGFSPWLRTCLSIIAAPTTFYQHLKLRRPDREPRRFAAWHYPAIGCLAAIWMFVLMFISAAPVRIMLFLPILVGFASTLMGWCVHRFIGALMTSWAMFRVDLPDVSWASVVMAYETAFLWIFCLYNGLLITSFFTFGNWMSQRVFTSLFGNQLGLPAEPLAVLLGNATLIAVWMWRYGAAYRHIRWSNY